MKKRMEISIFEVFEKMFFIFLEASPVEYPHYAREASIIFTGNTKRGEVKLFITEAMSKNMVHNMLGLKDGDISEKEIEDCSKEAVNMICGNFLANVDDHTDTFNLTMPVFRKSPEIPAVEHNMIRLDFVSDDGQIGATLRLSVE